MKKTGLVSRIKIGDKILVESGGQVLEITFEEKASNWIKLRLSGEPQHFKIKHLNPRKLQGDSEND